MKSKNKKVDEETFSILSDLNELKKIEEMALRISKKASLSEEQSYNLAIVLTELVNNAIVHGNKNIRKKRVFLKAYFHEDRLEVSVCDQGNGFDPANLENPTNPENIWKETGRGIFLVKNLMDEVKFYPRKTGMEVIVVEYKRPK